MHIDLTHTPGELCPCLACFGAGFVDPGGTGVSLVVPGGSGAGSVDPGGSGVDITSYPCIHIYIHVHILMFIY